MKKSLILLGVASTFLLGGCKKFLDVNKNPNTPTSTDTRFVLTNALSRTVANQVGGMLILGGDWAGYYAHSTSFSGGGQEKTYQFSNTDFNFFDGLFDNIADYQYVIDKGRETGVPFYIGPAMIMQVYNYQKLVDLYGNVPYSEAMGGVNRLTPKYDDAKTIYESLITKLTAAIDTINHNPWATGSTFTSPDIMFGGNTTNWKRFANTLKMRILMRQSFMPGRDAYIQARIAEIVADGSGFITDNVYIQPGYQKITGKLNPFYATYGFTEVDAQTSNFAYRKVNAVMINWLKSSLDTFRLQRLAYPSGTANVTIPATFSASSYTGVPLGAPSGFLESACSSIGPIQIQKGDATRQSILMTVAEMYFLLAEAQQRYGTSGLPSDAKTNYENGVKYSFRLCTAAQTFTPNASIADADAYSSRYLNRASGNNITWNGSTDKIRAILIQKWVALCHIDGLEAWSEYRKSSGSSSVGVPSSVKSVAVDPSDPEPVRLYYPLTEESTNGTNVPQNIDVFTSKIFWDVN